MKKIRDIIENQLIINKSRFITTIIRVNSIEEINEHLTAIRKKYYDATHNCYAYILGNNGDIQKCSDDGEPSKTAGFPILDVLQKQKVTDVLCVVTRYFGGTLLGAGGLVRAYSNSASEALKIAVFYKLEMLIKLELTLDYSEYNNALNLLNEYTIIDTLFEANVKVILAVNPEDLNNFISNLTNITLGKAIIIELGSYELETRL